MSQRDAHILRALISIQGSLPSADGNLRRALAEILAQAAPITEPATVRPVVGLNDRITLRPLSGTEDDQMTFQVVLPPSSDPVAGKISIFAPMSIGVIGRSMGETVTVETPAGAARFKIVDVKKTTQES